MLRLTSYGRPQWLVILAVTAALTAGAIWLHWWWLVVLVWVVSLSLLSFFRDPERRIPVEKSVMVSPADGVVSSVHSLDHYEPLGGPATCVRIFLSVLNVHVNRSPCHGHVASISPKPGQYLDARNPRSAEVNASNLIVMVHPVKRTPVCAVRQVAGLIARHIVCGTSVGETLQRGERFGMIKFGSTTELYVPATSKPEVLVKQGQRVHGGETLLFRLHATNAVESVAEAAASK